MKFKLRAFLIENAVPIIIIVLLAFAIPASGLSGKSLLQILLTQLGRNAFLVIALILPIMAGMGLNFGIPLGTMAGQIGLIFAVDWGGIGIPGLLLAALISLPISILLGWLCGSIMNKSKGQEMLTGVVLSSLTLIGYTLFTEYVMGGVIPVINPKLLLSRGYGLRTTINLENIWNAFDKFIPVMVWGVSIPIFSYILIAVACVFIIWFKKTRPGENMRATGLDYEAADAAGIAVDRSRIIAIIISTVLAGFGQIISLQNTNNIITDSSHRQVGLFSIAALLIGGASVKKASIPNALLGVVLFHLAFLVVPSAAKNLTDSLMFSEYLRILIIHGVILLTLVLYFWKRANQEKETDVPLLSEYEASTCSYKDEFGLLQVITTIYLLALFFVAPVGSLSGALSKIFTGIGMSGVFVLALVPMIQSGCGLNFGLPIGVIAGLIGATISIEMSITGVWGFVFAIIISQVFGAIFGYGYGALLNSVKSGEMIVSMNFSAIAVMFASIAWYAIPFTNPVIGRNSFLGGIWVNILNDFLAFEIAGFKFPTGLILFFLLISLVVWAFYRHKIGAAITNRTRVVSVIISTMLAALGTIVYQQSVGFFQLYNTPNIAIPATAAIISGGAGINKASLTNVFIGLVLYQGILVMTPIIFKEMGTMIVNIISFGVLLYALTRKNRVML